MLTKSKTEEENFVGWVALLRSNAFHYYFNQITQSNASIKEAKSFQAVEIDLSEKFSTVKNGAENSEKQSISNTVEIIFRSSSLKQGSCTRMRISLT